MNHRILAIACTTFMLVVPSVYGDLLSDAAELGANSGAMKYCRENFATEEDDGRYKLIALAAGKELEKLDGDAKAKALLVKKAAEDGDYLGKPLDVDRCASIRKLLAVKYSID